MHHDHCRPLGLACQRIRKPADGVVIHIPMVLFGDSDVEANHSHRSMTVGDEMQWPRFWQIGMISEALTKIFPIIMVARDDKERLHNPGEEFPRDSIFSQRSLIHQIAAQNHEVRARKHAVQMTDRGPEHRV